MRITVPIKDALSGAIRPEPLRLKYGTASENGRSVFTIVFKDKRPSVKGDRDTEYSDYNRVRAFFDQSREKPYVLWINAMTIIVGRGEPPELPAHSFQEGFAANREILNWVESRCIVIHLETQSGAELMQNMFPYADAMPRGTEPCAGWMKNNDFYVGLKTQPGFVEMDDASDVSLYTKEGLKVLRNDALADLAVRNGIIDAVPTWGQQRLISEILADYKKRTAAEPELAEAEPK